MATAQVSPAGSTSAELGKTLAADLARWGAVMQSAKFKPLE